ncbi:MAG: redox-sensing transcriptional repressor Rex [Eubacteriales bacterium]|nr:redox-sensing transcriptional repressor Rex [Eubacteriales bacterium]
MEERKRSDERKISKAVIRRLPRYYRFLSELYERETERISSKELSRLMGLTASQIRQDLNNFGEFGLQGYGYNVAYLKDEIGKVLGINKVHRMILIGAGNLGQAIVKYGGFTNKGFIFTAVFDYNPNRTGEIFGSHPIRHLDTLAQYLEENPVDVVVLTVPKRAVADIVKIASRRRNIGIWNFASMDIKPEPGMTVENVHLSDSLMRLSYNLKTDREMQRD